MSWDKFDANRAAGDKGRPSSADKLAEAVKSSLGDRGAAPRPGDHPGHVVSRPVESRPVVSTPVTAKRVTRVVRKQPGGGSLERKATTGTAAERLVADRDARAQSHYEKVAARAEKAGRSATDEAGHAEAYRQHVHAANVAPNEELRTMHMKAAVSHDRANVYARSTQARAEGLNAAKARTGQPTSPVKAPTEAERAYTGNRDRAAYLSSKATTPADHRAAAAAHRLAAENAPSPVLRKMHERHAALHDAKAGT